MGNVSTIFYNNKPRILVVDDDPQTRVSNQFLLMHWGYEPVLAMGEGNSLINHAKMEAKRTRCSLALIDLRLLDNSDDEDFSGLNLAKEIGPVKSIIFSGHGNQNVLRAMLENPNNISFVSKDDPREKIRETLDREAKKVCATKRGLQIDPPDILNQIFQTTLGATMDVYSDQIADVLAQLFPDAQKLRVEKLGSKLVSSNISTVPRPTSVILKVYEDEFEPVVVKLARTQKISKEVERYYNFISRRLTGSFAPRLERYITLWDIGGATYSYVGDFDVKTFSQYYLDSSTEDIAEGLRSFFVGSWSKHYSRARDEQNVSLFKLYCNVWDQSWYKRIEEFTTPNPITFHQMHDGIAIPDPIVWLKNNVVEDPNRDASWVDKTRIAITHGDLHGENLLIDSKKNAWVIDFERSGEGHALQDFVELESDILNRLTFSANNSYSFYRLCITIVRQTEIGLSIVDEPALDQLEIWKFLKTISVLRELAHQSTGISDMRQYLIGLLFNAIFRATLIPNDDGHKRSQQRSLMLASIICHRLDHWGEAWPPEEWNRLS